MFDNKSYQKEYYRKKRDRMRALMRQYLITHREEGRARTRKWAANNPDKVSAKGARYYERIKVRHKELMRAWWKAHPERSSMYSARRRAACLTSSRELKEILEWEKTWRFAASVKCHWCSKIFRGKECHADHVIPLSRGGMHCRSNLVVACARCNVQKRDLMPEEWKRKMK